MSTQSKKITAKKIEEAYREAVTDFTTPSGIPVKEVYTPDDISQIDFDKDIGLPGQYPFTRGHHPQMYRGKLWNIRQIIGLSTPKRQNERLKFVLSHGANAVDCEMDTPTWYGIEPDQPYAEGQFGVCGVALHNLRDVEAMTEGLPMDALSMCWNYPLPALSQAYILTAKRRGYDISDLRVVHSALYLHLLVYTPSWPEVLYTDGRFSTLARWGNDFCEYILRNLPKWNIWYADGAAFCESGANAVQEIAFIIACRDELIREILRRGVDINAIGRGLSPTVGLDRDFFEHIAKLRAARKIWARTMKEKWGATDPKAMCLRAHGNIVGTFCTRQQPLVNIARGAIGALAGILGGCMGIQVACYDEAWSTPTEEAERIAIRTQQVLRYESGTTSVADPLAGSYYVEWLTSKFEEEIQELVDKIEDLGGWMAALKSGWIHEEVKKGLLDIQRKIDNGERVVVGVNRFQIPPEEDFKPQLYAPDNSDVDEYLENYRKFKEKRNYKNLKGKIKKLQKAASEPETNLVPYVYEALEADATFAEIIGVMRMNDGLDYDREREREFPF
ncbi:MAG: methylmalonyl-CoA mutase family protein [Thermodesulfobacteriota bacterium]